GDGGDQITKSSVSSIQAASIWATTPVLAIPVVYWLKPILDLLHKYSRLNLAFWLLVAVFAWQGALVGWLLYGVLITPKDAYTSNADRKKHKIRLVLDDHDIETGEYVGSSFW
ncbi:hypothetical protein ACLHZ0_16395, partial [Aeromonas salmonicida]|uniref:hypothetical protein n=1 Tax=Aeromonas salmonicida TaxID=645 RepID=UPI003D05CFC2